MGRIVRLELTNFKSYAGHQVVGPFTNFTAIVGPNGAGKSNLMDAISFVLGINARHLRGDRLTDLLHNRTTGRHVDHDDGGDDDDDDDSGDDAEHKADPAATAPSKKRRKSRGGGGGGGGGGVGGGGDGRLRHAAVVLVFMVDEVEAAKFGVPTGDEVTYERRISADGQSSYRFQGSTVSWDAYKQRLVDINVLVAARNFLVFQGDVESLAARTPKDLMQYFEIVSGSQDYRDDYEALQQKSHESEQTFLLANNDRKNLLAERKELKREKDEAEQYQERVKSLAGLKQQLALWRLYHIDASKKEAAAELETRQETAETLRADHTQAESHQKTLKREEAKLQRQKATVDASVTKAQDDARAASKAHNAATKNLELSARTLAELEGQQSKMQTEAEKNHAELQRLARNIEACEAKMAETDKALQSSLSAGLSLSPEQEAEIQRLEALAKVRTVALRSHLDSAEQRRSDASTELEPLVAERADYEQQLAAVREREVREGGEMKKFEAALADSKTDLQALQAKLEEAKASMTEDLQRQAAVQTELDELKATLADHREDRNATKRSTETREALNELKRHFRGVHGRMCDLLDPTEQRWKLAVATALGRHMESVVVDTTAVGQECIKYLMQQQRRPMSFLPLDNLRTKPVRDAVMARMRGPYRMARDCVKYDRVVKKAVEYAFGTTVICDTYKDAERLRFGDRVEAKCVTLDGTVIAKNCHITGGSAADDARSHRFDEEKIHEIKERVKELTQEAESLRRRLGGARGRTSQSHYKTQAVTDAQNAVATADSKCSKILERLEQYATSQSADSAERRELEGKLTAVEPRIAKITAGIAKADEDIAAMTAQIREVEDEVFAEFSRSVGVDSYAELQASAQKHKEELLLQSRELANRHSKMQNTLQLRQRHEFDKKLAGFSAKLQKESKKREKLEESCARAEEKLKAAKQAAADARQSSMELDEKLKEKAAARAAARKAVAELAKRLESVQKDVSAKQAELARLEGTWRDTLARNPDMDEAAIDFTAMTHDPEREDQARVDAKLNDDIRSLTALVEESQPNLKAFEKFEEIEQRLIEQEAVCRKAREASRAQGHAFHEVKRARLTCFMDLFEFVAANIDDVYKDLTRSDKHREGGSASLVLANVEDPFSDGIRFNAMPPTKRFSDIGRLSGGEKTVASLALLFTIHKGIPAPFYVLDEIDAALDNTNIQKVSSYIRSRALASDHPLQCLVISLKDAFYGNAESVIGIYKDRARNSSQTLTLDLSPYPLAS